MHQIRPVIRLAVITATLLVAIYVNSFESQENNWSFNSTAFAGTVPEIVIQAESTTGRVGVAKQPVIIAISTASTMLTAPVALNIKFDPPTAGEAYAGADSFTPLGEGELKIDPEQNSATVFIEWLQKGPTTLIVTPNYGEELGTEVVKTFQIDPATPTKLQVDTTFIGRNDEESGPNGFDYELTVTQKSSIGRDVDFAPGTKLDVTTSSDSENVIDLDAPDHEVAADSIITLADSQDVKVKLKIPEGETTLNLTIEKEGLPAIELALAALPVKVEVKSDVATPSLDDTLTSTPFTLQYFDRNGNPLTIDGTDKVVAEVFDGSTKFESVWMQLSGDDISERDGVFTPTPADTTYTVQVAENEVAIDGTTQNLKLCFRFEAATSSADCEGLELRTAQVASTESSRGGVVLRWQPTGTANVRSQEYRVTVSGSKVANFELAVEKLGEFRRTAATTSTDGSATASVNTVCDYVDPDQPEAKDENGACAIRVWINPLEEFEDRAEFDITVSAASAPDTSIVSDQFTARVIGTPTVPSQPSAILESEVAKERIHIVPNAEDGGSEQRFLVAYRTKNSGDLVQVEVTFEEWTAFPAGELDEQATIIWSPPDLETDEKISEFWITAVNDQGYGEQVKGKTPPGGTLSGINWLYVTIGSTGFIAFGSMIVASWIISRKRQRGRWLTALAIASDSPNRKTMQKYVDDENSRDAKSRANILNLLVATATVQLKTTGVASLIGNKNQRIYQLANDYSEFDSQAAIDTKNEINRSIKEAQEDEQLAFNSRAAAEKRLDSITQQVESAEGQHQQLAKLNAELTQQNSELGAEIAKHQRNIEELKANFENDKAEVDREIAEYREKAEAEHRQFVAAQRAEETSIVAEIKDEIDNTESQKQEASRELGAINDNGYQRLLEDAVSAVSSRAVLEEMIVTGRVSRTVEIQDLVAKISQMQEDGLRFSTSVVSGSVSISHPVVNDLTSMRRLVTSSLEAFGAWLLSSTEYARKPLSPSPTPDTNNPDAMISELAKIDTRFDETGFGIASGLKKVVELSVDRIGNHSHSDDRARSYDEQAFWTGVSEAINMLTNSAIADVYPEFIESLGLENDDDIEGVEIGPIDAGPADALARYVIADWFSQRPDTEVISIASTTVTRLEQVGTDQDFTAYHFKQNVINNLVIRWGGRETEGWNVAQAAGFGIICDYIARYSQADLTASWSEDG